MLKKSIFFILTLLVVCLAVVYAQDTARLEQLSKEIEQLSADYNAGKITIQEFQRRALELQNQVQAAQRNMQQGMEQASSSYSFTDTQMRRLLELMDQSNAISARFNEGQMTEATATSQIAPIKREIDQIYAPFANLSYEQGVNIRRQTEEIENQLEQIWPGSIMGMPPIKGAFPNDERDRSYLEVGKLTRPLRQAPNTRASYSPLGSNSFGRVLSRYIIYLTGPGATQAAMEDLKQQIESATGKTMQRVTRTSFDWGETFVDVNAYFLEFIDSRKDPDDPRIRHWSVHSISLKDGTLRYFMNDGGYDIGPDTNRSGEH